MKVLAPAKLNLFLKVVNKREDGYHNINTGVTFINLYDEVFITLSTNNRNSLSYVGPFSPVKNNFDDDVVKKLLNFIYLDQSKKFYLNIKIKKNIPFNAGLGGGSADAAAVLRGLKKLKIILKDIDNRKLSSIGADIPMCIKSKDCIATGIGEKLDYNIEYPKNFFLLVKPNFSLQTKKIYSNFKFENSNQIYSNDLQKTAIKMNSLMQVLLNDLASLRNNLFISMSGSGSCCYAAFKNLKDVNFAVKDIKSKYPNHWLYIATNKL